MTAHLPLAVLIVFCICAVVSGYAGEYIPKSYYVIANGHQSDTVYLRSKRSLLHLLRKRRSSSIPGVPSSDQFYADAQSNLLPENFLNHLPTGGFHFPAIPGGFNMADIQRGSGGGYGSGSGSGAFSYSGSFASGTGGHQDETTNSGGPSNSHHYSNIGPNDPQEFSRTGEARGNRIHVSGSAAGPNGAFSSSSAHADENGNVRYSVNTRKY